MSILQRLWLGPLLLGAFAIATPTADAQILVPPNNGFNATIALPSTIDAFWTGVNEGLEKAGDGLDHLAGAKGPRVRQGAGSLDSLQRGTPVAVQYTVKGIQSSADGAGQIGDDVLTANEGVVTKVDRGKKEVTVRFADGQTQKLESENSFTSHSSRAIVYFRDQSGRRVAHYFKPAD
jgi:hypothetical protein